MTRLYSPTLIVMHWLLAILIGAQLSLYTVLPTGLHVTLAALIGLYTVATLYRQWYFKDPVMARMKK